MRTWQLLGAPSPFARAAVALVNVTVALPTCGPLWELVVSECSLHVSRFWPASGLVAGPAFLFFPRLKGAFSSADNLNVTCPLGDWQALLTSSATVPGLAPCGTATVHSGQQLLDALEALQPGHARLLITLAANITLPASPTPPREDNTADDATPLVELYRGGWFNRERGVPQPVLVMADLQTLNAPSGPPSTWPLGLLSFQQNYLGADRSGARGIQRIGLRSWLVTTVAEAAYIRLWYTGWLADSADGSGQQHASSWMAALMTPVTQVRDEDGGQSSVSRLSFMLSYNTSTSVSARTAPHEYDMWTGLMPASAGSSQAAPSLSLPLLPPASFAAAASASQLLQLLQLLQQDTWARTVGPRVIFLLSNVTLSKDAWPEGGAALRYPVVLAGPASGAAVWLDVAGMSLVTPPVIMTAAYAAAAGGGAGSTTNMSSGRGGTMAGDSIISLMRLRVTGLLPRPVWLLRQRGLINTARTALLNATAAAAGSGGLMGQPLAAAEGSLYPALSSWLSTCPQQDGMLLTALPPSPVVGDLLLQPDANATFVITIYNCTVETSQDVLELMAAFSLTDRLCTATVSANNGASSAATSTGSGAPAPAGSSATDRWYPWRARRAVVCDLASVNNTNAASSTSSRNSSSSALALLPAGLATALSAVLRGEMRANTGEDAAAYLLLGSRGFRDDGVAALTFTAAGGSLHDLSLRYTSIVAVTGGGGSGGAGAGGESAATCSPLALTSAIVSDTAWLANVSAAAAAAGTATAAAGSRARAAAGSGAIDALIGGVVGGAVAFLLLLLCAICAMERLRRRQRQHEEEAAEGNKARRGCMCLPGPPQARPRSPSMVAGGGKSEAVRHHYDTAQSVAGDGVRVATVAIQLMEAVKAAGNDVQQQSVAAAVPPAAAAAASAEGAGDSGAAALAAFAGGNGDSPQAAHGDSSWGFTLTMHTSRHEIHESSSRGGGGGADGGARPKQATMYDIMMTPRGGGGGLHGSAAAAGAAAAQAARGTAEIVPDTEGAPVALHWQQQQHKQQHKQGGMQGRVLHVLTTPGLPAAADAIVTTAVQAAAGGGGGAATTVAALGSPSHTRNAATTGAGVSLLRQAPSGQYTRQVSTTFAQMEMRISQLKEAVAAAASPVLASQGSGRGSKTTPRLLGKGAYGVVELGGWKGTLAAIKTVVQLVSDARRLERLASEVAIACSLSHPCLVATYDYSLEQLPLGTAAGGAGGGGGGGAMLFAPLAPPTAAYSSTEGHGDDDGTTTVRLRLVMEYCEGGTLKEALLQGLFDSEPPAAASTLTPAPSTAGATGTGGTTAAAAATAAAGKPGSTTAAGSSRGIIASKSPGGRPQPQQRVLQTQQAVAYMPHPPYGQAPSAAVAEIHASYSAYVAAAAASDRQQRQQQQHQDPAAPSSASATSSSSVPAGNRVDSGGNRRSSIDDTRPRVRNLPLALVAARDILAGLTHLHACSVIHGDLNENNILLRKASPLLPVAASAAVASAVASAAAAEMAASTTNTAPTPAASGSLPASVAAAVMLTGSTDTGSAGRLRTASTAAVGSSGGVSNNVLLGVMAAIDQRLPNYTGESLPPTAREGQAQQQQQTSHLAPAAAVAGGGCSVSAYGGASRGASSTSSTRLLLRQLNQLADVLLRPPPPPQPQPPLQPPPPLPHIEGGHPALGTSAAGTMAHAFLSQRQAVLAASSSAAQSGALCTVPHPSPAVITGAAAGTDSVSNSHSSPLRIPGPWPRAPQLAAVASAHAADPQQQQQQGVTTSSQRIEHANAATKDKMSAAAAAAATGAAGAAASSLVSPFTAPPQDLQLYSFSANTTNTVGSHAHALAAAPGYCNAGSGLAPSCSNDGPGATAAAAAACCGKVPGDNLDKQQQHDCLRKQEVALAAMAALLRDNRLPELPEQHESSGSSRSRHSSSRSSSPSGRGDDNNGAAAAANEPPPLKPQQQLLLSVAAAAAGPAAAAARFGIPAPAPAVASFTGACGDSRVSSNQTAARLAPSNSSAAEPPPHLVAALLASTTTAATATTAGPSACLSPFTAPGSRSVSASSSVSFMDALMVMSSAAAAEGLPGHLGQLPQLPPPVASGRGELAAGDEESMPVAEATLPGRPTSAGRDSDAAGGGGSSGAATPPNPLQRGPTEEDCEQEQVHHHAYATFDVGGEGLQLMSRRHAAALPAAPTAASAASGGGVPGAATTEAASQPLPANRYAKSRPPVRPRHSQQLLLGAVSHSHLRLHPQHRTPTAAIIAPRRSSSKALQQQAIASSLAPAGSSGGGDGGGGLLLQAPVYPSARSGNTTRTRTVLGGAADGGAGNHQHQHQRRPASGAGARTSQVPPAATPAAAAAAAAVVYPAGGGLRRMASLQSPPLSVAASTARPQSAASLHRLLLWQGRIADDSSGNGTSGAVATAGSGAAARMAAAAAVAGSAALMESAAQLMAHVFKISDFGLSMHVPPGDQTHISGVFQGTPVFTAPEVVFQGRLSPAADMYSFGVVLWLLLHGVSLRGAGLPMSLYRLAPIGPELLRRLSPELPPGARQLLAECLDLDPGRRPTAAEAGRRIMKLLEEALGLGLASVVLSIERVPLG
ncbi:hypothetical protein HYH02_014408 [Chlamydomonas schloesseri]|uniref:Protein kinase domain-containing protein n=1 Tax=Chlamydomonas schloesseri TaxID=2026947 RepID=A0A835SJM3_9CHLO|nr:hypothetical protein HYH02_014408 [Chlamydomonas schloesseri]|eukprot:KAG2428392.1 hypothetical protein HYH02_014408 [Chlamydomonas schloesseri]